MLRVRPTLRKFRPPPLADREGFDAEEVELVEPDMVELCVEEDMAG